MAEQEEGAAVLPHQHPIFQRGRDHFRPGDLMYIDVDAWPDKAGNPTRIYFYPYNTADKAFAARKADFGGAGVEAEADVLIRKAVDEHGKRIFCEAHRPSILTDLDPQILSAIIGLIMTSRTVAAHLKNLKAIPVDG